jgi:hypothetical protein
MIIPVAINMNAAHISNLYFCFIRTLLAYINAQQLIIQLLYCPVLAAAAFAGFDGCCI